MNLQISLKIACYNRQNGRLLFFCKLKECAHDVFSSNSIGRNMVTMLVNNIHVCILLLVGVVKWEKHVLNKMQKSLWLSQQHFSIRWPQFSSNFFLNSAFNETATHHGTLLIWQSGMVLLPSHRVVSQLEPTDAVAVFTAAPVSLVAYNLVLVQLVPALDHQFAINVNIAGKKWLGTQNELTEAR